MPELEYVTEGMGANSGNVTLCAKHGMAKLPAEGFVHSENVMFSVLHELKHCTYKSDDLLMDLRYKGTCMTLESHGHAMLSHNPFTC